MGTHNQTDTWEQTNVLIRRDIRIHPKSIDFDYENDVFNELNSLGVYDHVTASVNLTNLMTYLFNLDNATTSHIGEEASSVSVSLPSAAIPSTSGQHDPTDLSQEVSNHDVFKINSGIDLFIHLTGCVDFSISFLRY